MELDLQQLTTEVCRIATEAGNFLRKERRSFSRERVVEKHAHDYVSYVDKESERLLVAQLSALLPEAGFIAEEGSAVYKNEPYCWVIDPLDGTTNYIHDNAPYCVSIALRSCTELLLGVVYEVCRYVCCPDSDVGTSFHSDGNQSFRHIVYPLVELLPGEAQVAVGVYNIFFVRCCFGPMFKPLSECSFV